MSFQTSSPSIASAPSGGFRRCLPLRRTAARSSSSPILQASSISSSNIAPSLALTGSRPTLTMPFTGSRGCRTAQPRASPPITTAPSFTLSPCGALKRKLSPVTPIRVCVIAQPQNRPKVSPKHKALLYPYVDEDDTAASRLSTTAPWLTTGSTLPYHTLVIA